MATDNPLTEAIAREAFELLGTGRQVTTFSSRYPSFNLAQSYDVAMRVCELRKARGEKPIGRKIGFTNRSVWGMFGLSGPISNFLFDTTVHELRAVQWPFPLTGMAEPLVEPEIVLHLAQAPVSKMSSEELFACVDWVCHGFEVVHSIFPGWQFTAADALAAYGVHGALLLGERHDVGGERVRWASELASFAIELQGDGGRAAGHGKDVLGSPIEALRFLVHEIERFGFEPLKPGEIITTGTLTRALPAKGKWRTRLSGIGIEGIEATFA